MITTFSNQKRVKKIKLTFNVIGIIIVLVGLTFLWMKMDTAVLITAGVFILYVGASLYPNLCYVYFSTDNDKVVIRYYPVISFLKKEYEAIEFPQSTLADYRIEDAMGFADLDVVIRTKRGVAEYPTVSLAALNKAEIEQIRQTLEEIIRSNKR